MMQKVKFFKKFLMPCGLCAAVPAVKPANPTQESPDNCSHQMENKNLIRPSELPIYTVDEPCSKKMICQDECRPSALEEGIGHVRRSVQGVFKEFSGVTDRISTFIDTGVEHSHAMMDYLHEESNILPRIGAVGLGGLTGLIFGLRGGRFKRLVYSSTGALAVAAITYPTQAKETMNLAKHYVNISYNFVYGVKPGDENHLEIKFPKLPDLTVPTSASEIFELISSGASATIGFVTDMVSNTMSGKSEETPTSESAPKKD